MSNELMEFRMTHLRSVALAWRDEDFRNQLLHEKDILGLFEERFG